jgi:hypothetical protein
LIAFESASDTQSLSLRKYEGRERIPLLPSARLVLVAPSRHRDTPVLVAIEWSPGVWERPLPGSSLWRAALTGHLARQVSGGPAGAVVRAQIEDSLTRFPDLECWWAWLRAGWLCPPPGSP